MVRLHLLFGACVFVAVAQIGHAWFWWQFRDDCPQQADCPFKCHSGYVTEKDQRGCVIKQCKCKNVCERFECTRNTRCHRKFACKRFGGCFVYPVCVAVLDLGPPTQGPVKGPNKIPVTPSPRTSTTVLSTTTHVPTTTQHLTTTQQPTTTQKPTTNGGEVVTLKTVSASLCPGGAEHLPGMNCDGSSLRSRPCPTGYLCQKGVNSNLAVCCPAFPTTNPPFTLRGGGRPSKVDVEVVTTPGPQDTFCSDGKLHLAGWNCGRGGESCPSTHKCVIHPADLYAVCCPIPVPDDEPETPPRDLPMCEMPVRMGNCKSNLPRWHFNSNTGRCEMFRYGGCGGNANNFKNKKACERSCGTPGQSYCSLPPKTGKCRAAFQRFYFDPSTKECSEFTFGGCNGNGNNFVSVEQCQSFCP